MLVVKPFRQESGLCGPASLKMILGYYGIDKSEKELAMLTNTRSEWGVEADEIVRVARDFGFKGQIKDNANFSDIEMWVLSRKIPVIVDWFSEDDGHYSVVVDIDKENIYLQDPEFGRLRAMRRKKFFRVWFDFPGDYIKDKKDIAVRRLIAIYPNHEKKHTANR